MAAQSKGAPAPRIYAVSHSMSDGFREAEVHLSNAVAGVSALAALLSRPDDGVEIDSRGLAMLLSHVEAEARAAQSELSSARLNGGHVS